MGTTQRRNDEQGVMAMEEPADMERLLSVHEVAEVLGTADGFVRRLVAARRIGSSGSGSICGSRPGQ